MLRKSNLILMLSTLAPAVVLAENFYIATYTQTATPGQGIYMGDLSIDSSGTTQLIRFELAALVTGENKNPSYITTVDNKYLYSVNEVSPGNIDAFAIQSDGKLSYLNSLSTELSNPVYITKSRTSNALFDANYGTGSSNSSGVQVFLYNSQNGQLTSSTQTLTYAEGSMADPDRQSSSHTHEIINFIQGEIEYAIAADLGADQLYLYRFNPETQTLESLEQFKTKAGNGPRHIAMSKDNKHIYVANELANNISIYRFSPDEPQTITWLKDVLPDDVINRQQRNYPAEILVAPDGNYLYLCNRGDNNIAVFLIKNDGEDLEFINSYPVGNYPRAMALSSSGTFIITANQLGNSITAYQVNQETGELSSPMTQTINTPVSVSF